MTSAFIGLTVKALLYRRLRFLLILGNSFMRRIVVTLTLLSLLSCSSVASADWKLVWRDNFNKLDTSSWTVSKRVIRKETFLSPKMVSVENGKLILRADGRNGFFQGAPFLHRGGHIDTLFESRSKAKRTVQVGNRIEWRVKHGMQIGCISALWGGRVNPSPPETGPDRAAPALAFGSFVFERWNDTRNAFTPDKKGIKLGFLSDRGRVKDRRQTVWYDPRQTFGESEVVPGKFRTFRTDWRSDRYEIFYEGIKVSSFTDPEVIPDGKLILQMRFAPFEGLLNGGAPLPKFKAQTEVDWIKVFKFVE